MTSSKMLLQQRKRERAKVDTLDDDGDVAAVI